MTKMHYSIMAAVAGLLLASASQASAGGPACCNDGIAASPKVRAMLNERKASCDACCAATKEVTVTRTTVTTDNVAASPKVRQMRADQARVAPASDSQIVGYRAVGNDGIAASPKVRSMLDAQGHVVEIAPLK
jgi:hypothetical protein